MIRLPSVIALVMLCGTTIPLRAQATPKWEYGRLFASHGVPLVFIVGTTATQVDSALPVMQRNAAAERAIIQGGQPAPVGPNELTPAKLLMTTMNHLGGDGWELVSIIPSPPVGFGENPVANWQDVEYFFKRLKPKP